MNKLHLISKKIFIYIFLVFLFSESFIRFRTSPLGGLSRVFYSLPWEFLHLESSKSVHTQIGIVPENQLAELLKNDSDHFPNCFEGISHTFSKCEGSGKYIVLRFKTDSYNHWGYLKCYLPSVFSPIKTPIFLDKPNTYNIIFPYPADGCEQKETKIFFRWKNFWGG